MSEHSLLMLSVWVTAFFACLGVVYGFWFESGMIFFDGLFSFVSLGMSIMSVKVLKDVQEGYDDERFPFGKAHFEPIVILIKSLVLGGICLFSIGASFMALLEGGHEVSPLPAVLYGAFCTLSCVVMTYWMHRGFRAHGSSLLESDRNEWWADTLLSMGIFAGFLGSYFLQGSELGWLSPYLDPLMVLLAATGLLILPVRTLVGSLREMLYYRAEHQVRRPVEVEAKAIADELNAAYHLRVVKIGRELSIELNLLVSDQSFSVSEMDAIRYRLARVADKLKKQHWVNVSFTHEAFWI